MQTGVKDHGSPERLVMFGWLVACEKQAESHVGVGISCRRILSRCFHVCSRPIPNAWRFGALSSGRSPLSSPSRPCRQLLVALCAIGLPSGFTVGIGGVSSTSPGKGSPFASTCTPAVGAAATTPGRAGSSPNASQCFSTRMPAERHAWPWWSKRSPWPEVAKVGHGFWSAWV
jgi:hypothetical protein